MDSSYYFFHAINSGWFHVEHGRVVLGISQLSPLIGYYLGLPLQILMLLSSVGHELFYFTVFLICYYKLKDQASAIVVLLVHLIGQLWLYYSPMLEICYGAALAVLLYALLKSGKYKDDKWMIFMLLVQWFAMTSHPENFALVGLVIAYDIINRGFKKRIHSITAGFVLLGFVLELLSFSPYESGHVNFLAEGKKATIGNLLDTVYLNDLWNLLVDYFPELLLMFMAVTAITWYKNRYWSLLLLFSLSAGIILMVNQLYYANDFSRYYESTYNPLVGIVVFLFIQECFLLPHKWLKPALAALAIVIALGRAFWIWDFGEDLRQRSEQLDRIVDQAQWIGYSKYLINIGNYQQPYSMYTWANPIETLLYSAVDGAENSVTIAEENEVKYEKNYLSLNDSTYIFRRFEIKSHDFLNDRFFELDEEPYHYLNQAFTKENVEELSKDISITVLSDSLHFEAGDTASIRIKIENTSPDVLRSKVNDGASLAYHWYQDKEVVEWDGMRTFLELDIYDEYIQDQQIAMPEEAGEYKLVLDLVIDGKMWFYVDEEVQVSVSPKSDTLTHNRAL